MKKKTRQVIKARKLWLWATEDCEVVTDIPPAKDDRFAQGVCRQVFVLPATAEAYDAMVEQGAKGAYAEMGCEARWTSAHPAVQEAYRTEARAVLKALSLVRPTK